MGNIEVAGYNDWFLRVLYPDSGDMISKGSIVPSAVFNTLKVLSNSRHIDIDEYKLLKEKRQNSALLAVLTFQHILSGMLRRVLREDSHTGISRRMFWEIPITLISIDVDRRRIEVFLIGFGLSNAEDVWLVGVDIWI